MLEFLIEPVNETSRLIRLVERLAETQVIALDIETTEWWNRERERVALVQIAYRVNREIKVAVIDALELDGLEPLRPLLEQDKTLKVIHNAAFDAVRLQAHYQFQITPVHDTMVAARLNKEKKYSLQAQAAAHLNVHLEKEAQRSDWSRRPLTPGQLHYAALDAWAALRLFEHQRERNLFGNYRLRAGSAKAARSQLSLELLELPNAAAPKRQELADPTSLTDVSAGQSDVSPTGQASEPQGISHELLALLGIIAELPDRFGPEQLQVSLGAGERVGLAGWIVDRTLGREAELEPETVKLGISRLAEHQLIMINPTGRLEATGAGTTLWRGLKTI